MGFVPKTLIGNRVLALRIDSGQSRSYAARMMDINLSTLKSIELGRHMPSVNFLFIIGQYYNASVDYFMTGRIERILKNPILDAIEEVRSKPVKQNRGGKILPFHTADAPAGLADRLKPLDEPKPPAPSIRSAPQKMSKTKAAKAKRDNIANLIKNQF